MENLSNQPVKPENQNNFPHNQTNGRAKGEEYMVMEIKRYKLYELAAIYKVNRKTFRGWVDKFKNEVGPREGHYYSIPQVKIILKKLELPSYVKIYPENSN